MVLFSAIGATVVGVVGAFVLGASTPRTTTRRLLFRGSVITAAIGVALFVSSLVPPAAVGIDGGLAAAVYIGGVAVLFGGLLVQGVHRYRERDDDVSVFRQSTEETETRHATFRRSLDGSGNVVREEVGSDEIPQSVGTEATSDSDNSDESGASTLNLGGADSSDEEDAEADVDDTFFDSE